MRCSQLLYVSSATSRGKRGTKSSLQVNPVSRDQARFDRLLLLARSWFGLSKYIDAVATILLLSRTEVEGKLEQREVENFVKSIEGN